MRTKYDCSNVRTRRRVCRSGAAARELPAKRVTSPANYIPNFGILRLRESDIRAEISSERTVYLNAGTRNALMAINILHFRAVWQIAFDPALFNCRSVEGRPLRSLPRARARSRAHGHVVIVINTWVRGAPRVKAEGRGDVIKVSMLPLSILSFAAGPYSFHPTRRPLEGVCILAQGRHTALSLPSRAASSDAIGLKRVIKGHRKLRGAQIKK